MKPVKLRPKFRCEFCKKSATEKAMIRHEKICYSNPDRTCETCAQDGIEMYKLGISDEDRICSSCEIAYWEGGNHFLDKEQVETIVRESELKF